MPVDEKRREPQATIISEFAMNPIEHETRVHNRSGTIHNKVVKFTYVKLDMNKSLNSNGCSDGRGNVGLTD